jgi:hypothetical protein
MDWAPVTSRMGRRIALVVALCAATPILLFAIIFAVDTNSTGASNVERELAGVSHLYSEVIRSRLGAAETIVLTLTAGDVGYDGAALKRQVTNSSAFKSVVVVDRDGVLAGGETTLRPSASQLLALEAGETVLLPVTLDGQLTSAFLVQAVNAAGTGRLAYFELAPDWLWKRVDDLPSQMTLAVVDADARVLYNVGPLSADATHIFADHITLSGERAGTLHAISWQDAGIEWHGIIQPMQLANERITAVPWAIVSRALPAGLESHSANAAGGGYWCRCRRSVPCAPLPAGFTRIARRSGTPAGTAL